MRLFVGVGSNDEDLEFQVVLEYALRKHTNRAVDLTWMRLSKNPKSFWYSDPRGNRGWNSKGWWTPFSSLRWGIPAACGFEGKAVYFDIDMIPLADIGELWDQPINPPAAMLSRAPLCVSVYDNARMKALLPPIEQIKRQPNAHRHVRQRFLQNPNLVQRYRGNWNCLDCKREDGREYERLDDPEIKLLHFTKVCTQPHLRYAIPRLKAEGRSHWYHGGEAVHDHPRKDAIELFDRLFEEAQAAGYTIDKYRNPEGLFGDYGR